MSPDLIARASIGIAAKPSQVWDALVDPDAIHEYMFGTKVVSDWVEGAPISWSGEWEGKAYEDKGVILTMQPERTLRYSHYSPVSGVPDVPKNYHTVTIELGETDEGTLVSLSQDHNASDEEKQHSEANWKMMLGSLKEYVE